MGGALGMAFTIFMQAMQGGGALGGPGPGEGGGMGSDFSTNTQLSRGANSRQMTTSPSPGGFQAWKFKVPLNSREIHRVHPQQN